MPRRALSKREIKDLIPQISPLLEVSPKQKVEIVDADKYSIMYVDDEPLLFEFEGRWLPLLRCILSGRIPVPYPKITVDMGAIKFVANGADIMRPGIVSIPDGISPGSPVLIVDEKHGKTLAIGVSMLSSEEMRSAPGGKVVKNANAAGDALWELTKPS
jgi:PUA-domain protein